MREFSLSGPFYEWAGIGNVVRKKWVLIFSNKTLADEFHLKAAMGLFYLATQGPRA
ncbi:MAG: hypothetical protein A4E53_03229 [Pelotomaculum sp. PtaB.Bin104]|nr:MAG: hypothetical protein A4E53_03229 [Pelotomaculum sp. PtaB.Bin104]